MTTIRHFADFLPTSQKCAADELMWCAYILYCSDVFLLFCFGSEMPFWVTSPSFSFWKHLYAWVRLTLAQYFWVRGECSCLNSGLWQRYFSFRTLIGTNVKLRSYDTPNHVISFLYHIYLLIHSILLRVVMLLTYIYLFFVLSMSRATDIFQESDSTTDRARGRPGRAPGTSFLATGNFTCHR